MSPGESLLYLCNLAVAAERGSSVTFLYLRSAGVGTAYCATTWRSRTSCVRRAVRSTVDLCWTAWAGR